MNCFEARNDFVAFWQKTLPADQRLQLLTHLRGCAGCDRSFRSFALLAPVLYSASEPDWHAEPARPGGEAAFEGGSTLAVAEYRTAVTRVNRLLSALVMAAAAVIAVYFAAPPHTTFEDAIAAENSNAEVATYPLADSILGQESRTREVVATDVADD